MPEPIEPVDAAELAALERAAEARDQALGTGFPVGRMRRARGDQVMQPDPTVQTTRDVMPPVPPDDGEATVDAIEATPLDHRAINAAIDAEPPPAHGPPPPQARTASTIPALMMVREDGTATALVDAAALDARLAKLERFVRHTMNLVVVLAEILRVDPREVAAVEQQNREAEARLAHGGQP